VAAEAGGGRLAPAAPKIQVKIWGDSLSSDIEVVVGLGGREAAQRRGSCHSHKGPTGVAWDWRGQLLDGGEERRGAETGNVTTGSGADREQRQAEKKGAACGEEEPVACSA
jgi:hypothetical protein